MLETIYIDDDSNEGSIIEVEIPRRETPPLIEVEDVDVDDIILNVKGKQTVVELAEDVIQRDVHLSNIESENNEKNQQKKQKKRNPKNMNASLTHNSQKKSSLQIDSPSHWTKDMIKFYNEDWGYEKNFSVEIIQSKMDKNPALWEISRKDILFMHNRLKKSHVRCSNCGQRGHNFLHCPEPPYVPTCHMCGRTGHVKSSCPNSICLNCGNKTYQYTTNCAICVNESERMCTRCLMKGHHFINCTDNWRLFHLTINQTEVREPARNFIYKNYKDIWCCNCGRQGHYQIFCQSRKDFGSFMDTYPFVASYQNAYTDYLPKEVTCMQPLQGYSQSSNLNNELVVNNLSKKPKKKKKNKKTETLLKYDPSNNVLKKETVKRKKRKKNKKKKKGNKVIKYNSKGFLPMGV